MGVLYVMNCGFGIQKSQFYECSTGMKVLGGWVGYVGKSTFQTEKAQATRVIETDHQRLMSYPYQMDLCSHA